MSVRTENAVPRPRPVSRLEHVLAVGGSMLPKINMKRDITDQLNQDVMSIILEKVLLQEDINDACKQFIKICSIKHGDGMCRASDWEMACRVLGVDARVLIEAFPMVYGYKDAFMVLCQDLNSEFYNFHDPSQLLTDNLGPPPLMKQPPMIDEEVFRKEWRQTYLTAMRTQTFNKKARMLIRSTNRTLALQNVLLAHGFVGRTKNDWHDLDMKLRNLLRKQNPNSDVDLDEMKVLIRQGASVDFITVGWPLLFKALIEKEFGAAKVLLEFGASMYVVDDMGWSIYEHIFHRNDVGNFKFSESTRVQMLEILLEAGEESMEGFDPYDNWKGEMRAGLDLALELKDTAAALAIIQHPSFDVNKHYPTRPPVLYEAIFNENARAVRAILLKLHNDELYRFDPENGQPLQLAILYNNLDVVSEFFKDRRIKDVIRSMDPSPYVYAIKLHSNYRGEDYTAMINFLREHEAV